MYLYYDKNGLLQEIVNPDSPHQASVDVDKIFIYVEGYETVTTGFAIFEASDGTKSNDIQVIKNQPQEIPYNAKRDLKFFEYFKKYAFFEITVPQEILAIGGLATLSFRISLLIGFKAIDIYPFQIKNNVINDSVCIDHSQYNYLLKVIADKTDKKDFNFSALDLSLTDYSQLLKLDEQTIYKGFVDDIACVFTLIKNSNNTITVRAFPVDKQLVKSGIFAMDYLFKKVGKTEERLFSMNREYDYINYNDNIEEILKDISKKIISKDILATENFFVLTGQRNYMNVTLIERTSSLVKYIITKNKSIAYAEAFINSNGVDIDRVVISEDLETKINNLYTTSIYKLGYANYDIDLYNKVLQNDELNLGQKIFKVEIEGGDLPEPYQFGVVFGFYEVESDTIITFGSGGVLALRPDGLGGVTSSYFSIPYSEKGQANGVATLDSTGKIPQEQLPTNGIFLYKGQVPTYNDLPKTGNEIGDTYDVKENGKNYVWNGTGWDDLGGETFTQEWKDKINNNTTNITEINKDLAHFSKDIVDLQLDKLDKKPISLPHGTDLYAFNWNDYENGTYFAGTDFVNIPVEMIDHKDVVIQLIKQNNSGRYALVLYHTGIYENNTGLYINFHYSDKFKGWEKVLTNESIELPRATADKLGGVKANPTTTSDTREVHIDDNGFLKINADGAGDKARVDGENLIFEQAVESDVVVPNNGKRAEKSLNTLSINGVNYGVFGRGEFTEKTGFFSQGVAEVTLENYENATEFYIVINGYDYDSYFYAQVVPFSLGNIVTSGVNSLETGDPMVCLRGFITRNLSIKLWFVNASDGTENKNIEIAFTIYYR